ncbi:MAG: GHKL domain-containing protein [Ruminococcus flavefaciens]|nr:GHKL domain-containing protein [Ruminococcus flavefaciens]
MSRIYWIAEYGATFAEFFLSTIFCRTFIENSNPDKKLFRRIFASMIAAALILTTNHIKLYSPITAVIGFVSIALLQIAVYPKSKIKAVIWSLIYLLLIAMTDGIIVSMLSYAFHIPTVDIYEEMSLYRLVALAASKIFLMFLTVILNRLLSQKGAIQKKYFIILFGVTAIMLALTVTVTFIDIQNESVNSYVSTLFFFMMLFLIIVIFFGAFKLTTHYEDQQQLKLTTLKNEMLEQSMEETEQIFEIWQRKLHDFKHQIIDLMSLAENDDMDGIKRYLAKQNDLLGKKLFYYKTGNDTVDSILYIKQKMAENSGIIFIINAEIPENCKIASEHFASILGNLLDNALEASAAEEKPFIEVKIKQVEDFLVISISNKCTKTEISLETTKPDKKLHGIGLHSVRHIIKRYNGEFSVVHKNSVFNANVMIPM